MFFSKYFSVIRACLDDIIFVSHLLLLLSTKFTKIVPSSIYSCGSLCQIVYMG